MPKFLWGKTDIRDHDVEVSAGTFPKITNFHRYGRNLNVPNGTYADVWSYGQTQAVYLWPTTTSAFRIRAGGNAADSASGANARQITVLFLDENGLEKTETITTNGVSASLPTVGQGRRFIRAVVSQVGTFNATNAGPIIIEHIASGLVVGVISTGMGQTLMSHYTIPKNKTAYVRGGFYYVTGGKSCDIRMWQRGGAYKNGAPFEAKRIFDEMVNVDRYVPFEYRTPRKITELTDLWIEAKGNGQGTSVIAHYDLEIKF